MVSRRALLKCVGAVGVTSAIASTTGSVFSQSRVAPDGVTQLPTSKELLAELEGHETTISSAEMVVGIDAHRGILTSITRRSDPLALNYLGNLRNTPSRLQPESTWTGDLAFTTWILERNWKSDDTAPNVPFRMSGKWRTESTAHSSDIRSVHLNADSLQVEYRGTSQHDGGIKSLDVLTTFTFDAEGALIWEFVLKNTTAAVLEVGEVGLPICVNSDYSEFSNIEPKQVFSNSAIDIYGARTVLQQSLIHEQKVIAHHFVGGHSSYSLIQRPLGDPPFLLFQTLDDTALECIYRETASDDYSFSVPEVLAVHSRAVKDLRGWRHNDWVNGHTSILLAPGEEKRYRFRFVFIPSYDDIRSELQKAGNLGIRIAPSMVIQENQEAVVEVQTNSKITAIEPRSDNVTISQDDRAGKKLLTLTFQGRGTKSIRIHYGRDRWTNLHFYCVEDFAELLKARAQFVVKREFYTNEQDPFHRYHMFLPFDYRKGNIILESDEVWEVGGSDEPGFSAPLFLAEKNVYYPNREEVDALEKYVSDCLFKYIQDPETYTVRASLYWVERKPSSPWSEWSKARSEVTWRTYNYVHPANIYHALYRIGKRYGLALQRDPLTYLRMSYRTCMKWFETGPWKAIGLMEGSNVLNILEDIRIEGWSTEYGNLLKAIQTCDEVFVAQPYPYSSELLIDQTAHEQVYFFTRFQGNREKNAKTIQVLKALRGGNQPVWFHYGNDKRGDICAWYSASLNGLALMRSFEDSGDQDALARGFGGVVSVMSNVTADGMGFNYFNCAAGVLAHEPPITWEGGCGLWGFLQAIKSIVVRDSALGLIGYGCEVRETATTVTVKPRDGVRKRIYAAEQKLSIELATGEIESCAFDKSARTISITPVDSTGLVKTVMVSISGLDPGVYHIGSERRLVGVNRRLDFDAPFEARKEITVKRISDAA